MFPGTSAVFSMQMDWPKLDVVTYSCVVLEVRLHMECNPLFWLKDLSLTHHGFSESLFMTINVHQKIFSGATINTPSMISVEDVLNSLNWSI